MLFATSQDESKHEIEDIDCAADSNPVNIAEDTHREDNQRYLRDHYQKQKYFILKSNYDDVPKGHPGVVQVENGNYKILFAAPHCDVVFDYDRVLLSAMMSWSMCFIFVVLNCSRDYYFALYSYV